MSALAAAMGTSGMTGHGNVIDMSVFGDGTFNASALPGMGDGTTITGLGPHQTIVFDDPNGNGLTNYHNISIVASGGRILVEDGAFVDGLNIAGAQVELDVEGLVHHLDAQGARVFDFQVAQTGAIEHVHFGDATVKAGDIYGTIQHANFNNATLSNLTFHAGSFLHDADFSSADFTGGVVFQPGVNLEDVYIHTPQQGRTYFASVEMLREAGLNAEGAGNITLSADAVAIASQVHGTNAADLRDTLDPTILAAFQNMGREVGTENPLVDGAASQHAVLDGEALAAARDAAQAAIRQ